MNNQTPTSTAVSSAVSSTSSQQAFPAKRRCGTRNPDCALTDAAFNYCMMHKNLEKDPVIIAMMEQKSAYIASGTRCIHPNCLPRRTIGTDYCSEHHEHETDPAKIKYFREHVWGTRYDHRCHGRLGPKRFSEEKGKQTEKVTENGKQKEKEQPLKLVPGPQRMSFVDPHSDKQKNEKVPPVGSPVLIQTANPVGSSGLTSALRGFSLQPASAQPASAQPASALRGFSLPPASAQPAPAQPAPAQSAPAQPASAQLFLAQLFPPQSFPPQSFPLLISKLGVDYSKVPLSKEGIQKLSLEDLKNLYDYIWCRVEYERDVIIPRLNFVSKLVFERIAETKKFHGL